MNQLEELKKEAREKIYGDTIDSFPKDKIELIIRDGAIRTEKAVNSFLDRAYQLGQASSLNLEQIRKQMLDEDYKAGFLKAAEIIMDRIDVAKQLEINGHDMEYELKVLQAARKAIEKEAGK